MRLILFIALIAAAIYFYQNHDWEQPGGFDHLPQQIIAADDPAQTGLKILKTVKMGEYTLTLTHDFSFQAVVLSKANYFIGPESGVSPVDLAVGWGPMSNPDVLKKMEIWQTARSYRYSYETAPPVRPREIDENSANMHMIPATEKIKETLKSVKRGDVIQVTGNLARVSDGKGWIWNSSMRRDDKGFGSGEIVYVTSIRILHTSR